MAYPFTIDHFMKIPKEYIPPPKGQESVDPAIKLKPPCVAKCNKWRTDYEECVGRVRGRIDGKGNCTGQYELMNMCIDQCVAHDLFKYLK
eukprot:GDKH01018281.1.p1 GENE.GDKH01018281.1~~GDKH01018281.1.p1  ORF type:complete len:90 (-),score=3.23 GDKH01018281.1:276-545(-)